MVTPIDPLTVIAGAEGKILLQAGRRDTVVPADALRALAEAAPDSADLRWYDAEHQLNEQARADQVDWLAERLR
jgi:fermentation-respiration switch protein FrsA (DUF1100 family)